MKKSSRVRSGQRLVWVIPAVLLLFTGLLWALRPVDLTPRVRRAEETVASLLRFQQVRIPKDLLSESTEWQQAGRFRWNALQQRYRVPAGFSWQLFRKSLEKELKKQQLVLLKSQRQTGVAVPPMQFEIGAAGLGAKGILYRAVLEQKPGPVPAPAVSGFPKGKGKIAIVLDDWGYTLRQVPVLAEIHRPLTVSILPSLPHSAEVAAAARAYGHPVILHMPMEAVNPHEPREADTLLTGMSRRDILDRLNRSFATVPGASGMNNHQGSKATSDPALMQVVLEEVKRRGILFLDSYTGHSVCGEMAQRMGVRFARRDVFLDNSASPSAIQKQLVELARVAGKKGRAIAIGHDRPATLETLRDQIPALEAAGYTLVPLSEVTEK